MIFGLVVMVKLSLLKKFLIWLMVWVIGCRLLFLMWWSGREILIVFVVRCVFSVVFFSFVLCVFSVCWICFFVLLIIVLVVGCFFGGSLCRVVIWRVKCFFLFKYLMCILFNVVIFDVWLMVVFVLVISFVRCDMVFFIVLVVILVCWI